MSNEIEEIKDELERAPHNIFEFMNYEKIVKKLNKALKEKWVQNIGKKEEKMEIFHAPRPSPANGQNALARHSENHMLALLVQSAYTPRHAR